MVVSCATFVHGERARSPAVFRSNLASFSRLASRVHWRTRDKSDYGENCGVTLKPQYSNVYDQSQSDSSTTRVLTGQTTNLDFKRFACTVLSRTYFAVTNNRHCRQSGILWCKCRGRRLSRRSNKSITGTIVIFAFRSAGSARRQTID